jgi:sulfite oxidase
MPLDGKRADMIVHCQEPFNAESPRSALTGDDLTRLDSFYVRNHGPVPDAGDTDWRVRVDGLVQTELELTVAELAARFEPREIVATLQCAGNRRAGLMAVRDIPGEAPWGPGATGTARWRGVRLGDLLEAAGLRQAAAHIEFEGADVSPEASPPQRFGGSIPRHKALAPEVLLAWEMNGAALPSIHGGPLRVVVPGYIGARSVKWLRRICVRERPSDNFFYARAYRLAPPDADPADVDAAVPLGAIAVNSEILEPEPGGVVDAGAVQVRGYAFAGDDRRIVRVDISQDGGTHWTQAELLDEPSPWSVRRWRAELILTPGEHQLVARAWDSAAATQPEHPATVWNPKGYVNNAWSRVTVTARG